MAINPPSDIVMDVLKAGDPTRSEAIANRLNTIGAKMGVEDFASVLKTNARTPSGMSVAAITTGGIGPFGHQANPASKASKAQVEFESVLLSNFVSELLPSETSDVYGQGTAGDFWKSMFGDQIAHQIAKSGRLGIAQKLFDASHLLHEGHPAETGALSFPGLANTTQTSRNALALPVSEMTGNVTLLHGTRRS